MKQNGVNGRCLIMPRPIKATLSRNRNTLRQALGSAITELRVKKKLSQEDLGHKSGYSARYIIKVEKGEQNPTLDLIEAIAQVFELKCSRLIARAERKQIRTS
jgi:transcriptional regulator with XRE-family HTH domain